MISALLSIVIHLSLIVILNKQISSALLPVSSTKELPKNQAVIPPPKVSFYEPEKRARVELPKETIKGLSKQAIDINKIQISAQLPDKIDVKPLAQAALTPEKNHAAQDLLTSLPPQIYEIKPVQKHLSRANTSQEDKRFNKT